MNEIQRKINKAKLMLMTEPNTTFFSALLAQLWLRERDDIPTAATDGVNLFYNPKFIEELGTGETLGLLLHEVLHVAFEHMDRRKAHDLNPQIWNAAADYYINNMLDIQGYRLPAGGLIKHAYDGWSTMQIYEELMSNSPDMEFEMDLIMDCPDGVDEEEHRTEVVSNVLKAVTQAKISNEPGSIPAEIARWADEIMNPKLPWNAILQNYMADYAKEEYTWTRPNKRFWPHHYLPSMRSEAIGQVTAAIDVSGSITQDDLDAFFSEINYIWDLLKPKKLRLMGFDTRIHDDLEFTEGDVMENITLSGGGGTDVEPVIDTIRKDEPLFLLVFTDGEFYLPNLDNLNSQIFWVIKGDVNTFNPDKGIVIEYDS